MALAAAKRGARVRGNASNDVCCNEHICKDRWAMDGHRQDGDEWTCPGCGRKWIHECDEAEGCSWIPPSLRPRGAL